MLMEASSEFFKLYIDGGHRIQKLYGNDLDVVCEWIVPLQLVGMFCVQVVAD